MSLIRDINQTLRITASDNTEKDKQSSITFTSKMNAKSHRVAKHPHRVKT